ncbi:MAG: hypothetical protein JWO19_5246 [Bryobacterales bacterium]|nr:hypothetical protein [Bryobacterales bacterium]
MTRDEARKLIGGYATGSLTESERTALFEAALQDQELFDELAGEQALKEVLDQPGARQRLLAALEPPAHRTAWWMRPWPWSAAAVTLAIAIIIVVSTRTPPPQQIAQVLKSPDPAATPVAPAPPTPTAPQAKRRVPPAPAPKSPPPAAQDEVREQSLADKQQPQKQEQDQAKAQVFGAARALRSENMTAAASGFALTYAVGADGFLEIVPAAPGFLSVMATTVIFSGAVSAGMPVRIQIPSEATSLSIGFSGMGGMIGSPVQLDAASGTVTDQYPPNRRIMVRIPAKP